MEYQKKDTGKNRISHWKLPSIPADNIEATRSILDAKLSDLDQLAIQLKSKLTTSYNKRSDYDTQKCDYLQACCNVTGRIYLFNVTEDNKHHLINTNLVCSD